MNKKMTRRAFLGTALVGGAGLAGYGLNNPARAMTNIDTSLTKRLEQPVIVPLTPVLINTYLVWGERPVLVDTGNPGEADAILSGLEQRGVNPTDISLILLTHGHADHIGSAAELRERTGAPIAIHVNDAEAARSGIKFPIQSSGTFVGNLAYSVVWVKVIPPFEPDIVLEGEAGDLTEFGLEARWLRTPGHTEGSISLLTKTRAVVGDLLAGNLFIRYAPDYPFFVPRDVPREESLTVIKQQAVKLLEQNIQRFYVGHGYDFDHPSLSKRFAS